MLSVTTFGSLMTLVTVSLGDIAEDLGSNRATMTWAITGLMLVMAVATPIAGSLGDVHGHRKVFLIGLAGGFVTTVASGLAWDAASLIGFRLLFGLFAAAVNPNAMALMMHAWGRERRTTAVGWFQFGMTGAPTLGILVGGPLIDVFGWRVVFFVFAGVSALAVIAAQLWVRPAPHVPGRRIDYAGASALGVSVLFGLLAITRIASRVREFGLGVLADGLVVGAIALCVLAAIGFVRIERAVAEPLLKLDYFRRRNFTMPLLSSACLQFAYMGGFVITPALLDERYGWTVGAIALLMLPRPGVFSLASPLGGWLPNVIGMRAPMVIGAVSMMAAMAAFAMASPLTSGAGIGLIVVGLVGTGFAAGVSQPAVTALVVDTVDPADVGVANGMNTQITFIGIVTGIQTMNVLIGDGATGGQFAGTYLLGFGAAAVGLISALAVRAGKPRQDLVG